jgi:hypothetical protein
MKGNIKKLIKRESQPYLQMCPYLKRQYIITCEQDLEDIIEGFCPYYAVFWSNHINSKYWKGEVFKHRPEYVIRANLALESLEAETKAKKTVSFDIFNEILFYEKNEKIVNYDYLLDDYFVEDYFVGVVDTDVYTNTNDLDIVSDGMEESMISRREKIQEFTQNLLSDLDLINHLHFF